MKLIKKDNFIFFLENLILISNYLLKLGFTKHLFYSILRLWAGGVRLFRQSLSPYGSKKTVYPVINYASSIPTQLYIKKITFWRSNPLVFLVSDIVFFGLTAFFLWKQAKTSALTFRKWLILPRIKEINRSSKSNRFHTFFKASRHRWVIHL